MQEVNSPNRNTFLILYIIMCIHCWLIALDKEACWLCFSVYAVCVSLFVYIVCINYARPCMWVHAIVQASINAHKLYCLTLSIV